MERIVTNLHTHTMRCGHAIGEDEEYVIKAIEAGITTLGFSDHVPLPGIHLKWMRPEVTMIDDYVSSMKRLKEKYKDKIDIYIGYEAEYYHRFKKYYSYLLKKKGIDYLIVGQHCFFKKEKSIFFTQKEFVHSKRMLKKYTNQIIRAIRSGLFIYIAHPDFIINGYQKDDEEFKKQALRIIKASNKYHVPLEINDGGLRHNAKDNAPDVIKGNKAFRYPYEPFWKMAGEYGASVVIGYDVHAPEEYFHEANDKAYEIVNKYSLHLIDPKQLLIRKKEN